MKALEIKSNIETRIKKEDIISGNYDEIIDKIIIISIEETVNYIYNKINKL